MRDRKIYIYVCIYIWICRYAFFLLPNAAVIARYRRLMPMSRRYRGDHEHYDRSIIDALVARHRARA